jgi:hypothetical protein
VEILSYFPNCRIWVSRKEAKEYKARNPKAKIIAVDPRHQGTKTKILNHILDTEFKRTIDAVAILDDDIQYFGYHEGNERLKLDPGFFKFWILKNTLLARALGVKVWGVNLNQDKQSYREYTPFSMVSTIGGPFMVHLKHDLRYDERMPTKDDYDMSLQQLNKYRRVLRLNKFFYVAKQAGSGTGQMGGCSIGRNVSNEIKQNELLIKKWGNRIVKSDFNPRSHSSKKNRGFDINPVVRVPIRGV